MKIYIKIKDECLRIHEDYPGTPDPEPIPIGFFDTGVETSSSLEIYKLEKNTDIFGYYFSNRYLLSYDEVLYTQDKEELILNVALLNQTLSGNIPDIRVLMDSAVVFPDKDHGGFSYTDFPDQNWDYKTCTFDKLTKYKWLYLKPEIFKQLLLAITEDKPRSKSSYSSAIEETLYSCPNDMLRWINPATSICPCYFTDIIKDYNSTTPKFICHESELQREEVSLLRGEKHSGSVICFRGCRPAVAVGHLGYKEILERG